LYEPTTNNYLKSNSGCNNNRVIYIQEGYDMKQLHRILIIGCVILLAGTLVFAQGQQGAKKISVGAKNFTEQYITGEIIALLLEDAGFQVRRDYGMSSFALRTAMTSGQIDICNDYTGSAWTSYLKKEEAIRDDLELFDKVKEADAENGITWFNRMAFNNTYALALTQNKAEELGIYTLEDLGDYVTDNPGELLFGVEYEFYERPDGFFAMAEEYDFSVDKSNVKTMDLGLTYDAVKNGDVDVCMVFSTDGNLVKYDLTVLEDTKNFFPIYNLCNVARTEVVEEYPEIMEILAPMTEIINQEIITNLNYQVDGGGRETEDVAYEFLESNGLID
jgi:osmoprotectant transport system substrate-binding protein